MHDSISKLKGTGEKKLPQKRKLKKVIDSFKKLLYNN